MKRSEFIQTVLEDSSNTVFTTEEQVSVAIEIFEKLGMMPPIVDSTEVESGGNGNLFVKLSSWEEEGESTTYIR